MPEVLERARKDLAHHEPWRARARLEGFIGSCGYQRDVVELLGAVCWQMGDVPAAGRYWFFTPLDRDEKRVAVEQLVRLAGGDPDCVSGRLPRNLRHGRIGRYPIEVQQRLQSLTPVRANRVARRQRPRSAPRSGAADTLAFGALGAIVLFFLYCFSLGLAQVIRTL